MSIQLKAHGAWLGGGTGVGVAGLVVGLLQQATHHTLAPIDVQTVYALVAVGGAFFGAHLLPALLPAVQRDLPGLADRAEAAHIVGELRDGVTDLRSAVTDARTAPVTTTTAPTATPNPLP